MTIGTKKITPKPRPNPRIKTTEDGKREKNQPKEQHHTTASTKTTDDVKSQKNQVQKAKIKIR